MMIASSKHFDGWALGFDKVGESSGEIEGNFGNIPVSSQTTPKDKFASNPNQLLKPREKPSEKEGENPSEKPSGKPSQKPCEEPHPKAKPKPICFHYKFCGKDGHKREFCYKRRREVRMAKEWASKDRYHPSRGVPEPHVPLPKGKGFVHKVPAQGGKSALGERDPARGVKPPRRFGGS
jgi:hypothetical protein